MCFSAPASFTAAAILGVIGVYSLTKATSKSDYALAIAPILFGIQQLVEGLSWLYLSNNIGQGGYLPYSITFLIIAEVVWPSYIPIGTYLFEKDKTRRKLIIPFVIGGLVLSVYLLSKIITGTVIAGIWGDHINYRISDVDFYEYTKYIYLVIVTLPFFLIKHKAGIAYGVFVLGAFIFTDYIAAESFVSVWCFFAAIISATIGGYFFLKQRRKS